MANGTEELLKELINLERLRARLDLGNFLDWAIKEGLARKDVIMYTLTLTAGTSVTLSITNPKNYVWIPHIEFFEAEVANKISVTSVRDGILLVYVPALPTTVTFNWNTTVPWLGPGIIRSEAVNTFVNTDVVDRYLIAGYLGTYLLDDEYVTYMREIGDYYPRDWKKYNVQ